MFHQHIPSTHMSAAKKLRSQGFSYPALFQASRKGGGIAPLEIEENRPCFLSLQEPSAF